MLEIPDALNDKLEEARRRVQSYRRWRVWLEYCLPASVCCLAFAVVARLVYVPYFAMAFSTLVAVCLLATMFLARRQGANSFDAAVRLDMAEGLKERLSTLVEVTGKGGSGEVARALLLDAQTAARDISPRESLVFRAPRTLPITLVLAIAAAAAVLAPRSFAHSESALAPVVRIALKEAVRMDTTARMLDESGAAQDIVKQIEELGRLLRKSDSGSVEVTLQAVRSAQAEVEKNLDEAARDNAAVDELRNSDMLGEMAGLLDEGAPAQQVSSEAAKVIEGNATEAAELLKEVIGKLVDSGMREKLKKALKALEERDSKAFAKSMAEFAREARKLAGTEGLEMTRARLAAAAEKLGAAKSPGWPAEPSAAGPGKNGGAAPEIGEGTALDEAMEKEQVPERFRNLVRVYFARSEAKQGREK